MVSEYLLSLVSRGYYTYGEFAPDSLFLLASCFGFCALPLVLLMKEPSKEMHYVNLPVLHHRQWYTNRRTLDY